MSGTQGNNFAASNRVALRYIVEQYWGQVPAAGTSRELRYTASSLAVKKGTTESTEIRDDRMISSIVETDMSVGGDFKWELSAGSQDDFFQAFLMGTWSRPMSFDQFAQELVSWGTATTVYVAGSDVSEIYMVGRYLKTEGFANPVNNGYWLVDAISFNAAANRTEIVLNATAGIPEVGGTPAKLLDANDIIVYNDVAIRSGTAGASTFDSNGGNAFAAAIAAGQLSIGQRIFVEGLGFETGSVSFSAQPSVGDTLVIGDGANTTTLVAGTSYAIGGTDTVTVANIAAALNKARLTQDGANVSATVAAAVLSLRNLGVSGGNIQATVNTGAVATVTAFTGGDDSQRGFFTVDGLTADAITVSPQPTTNANAGGLHVVIKGSMLRNPGVSADIVTQSFNIETEFNDVGKYLIATGLRVSDFDMDVSATKISTGSFTFMGKSQTAISQPTLALTPFVVLPTTTTEVMNGTTNVGEILKNGAPLATAVQQVTMKGNGNLRAQQAVSSKFPVGIGTGRFTLTGTLVAYFEDTDLYNNFLNHDTVAIAFQMTDEDNQSYFYTVPAAKFTSDPVAPEGMDQDIMEKMDWMAQRDPVTACMMQIDRFSSVAAI